MIKIAFISRSTLYSSPGGDTRQIDMTAKYLRLMEVQVDIYLTNQTINYDNYDLLHFFNIIRPADILKHILKSKKRYVVSTIFLDYGDFEKTGRKGLKKLINKIFSTDQIEYLKAIARWIVNGEKIGSIKYLLWGHKTSVKYVANHASMLLPNSESEYSRFLKRYEVSQKYHVVPNGIDADIINKSYTISEQYKNAIICVARIEARKNQLNLIRALNNTKYTVLIQGKPSPNNIAYFEQCKNEAAANVYFPGWVNDDELLTMYHSAKVHILPSYFETTGLSSLEAAVLGCNIVVTDKGDTKEYFKDFAWYCEPDDLNSIKDAIDNAYNAPYNKDFRDYILKHYTWQRAAEETLSAYNKVLNKE
jgi:glycosyltransferase involved in cell wall biosynthesis